MTYCFPSENELSDKLSIDFLHFISEASHKKKTLSIAFSGGNTPKSFFERIVANQLSQGSQVMWNKVHIFWADERCVPPNHTDSNYGMTNESLLRKINLDDNNVHRIHGENDPSIEAVRYSAEIKRLVELQHEIPVFDWIFLGIGDDGHTASIFPGRLDLLDSGKICETVEHPLTGQFRITLTGNPILQAKRITFMVTGKSKSNIVRQIMNNDPEALSYPAAQINLRSSNTEWFIDQAAAKYLNITCRGKY
jgi:6-phosphogluconolactonase